MNKVKQYFKEKSCLRKKAIVNEWLLNKMIEFETSKLISTRRHGSKNITIDFVHEDLMTKKNELKVKELNLFTQTMILRETAAITALSTQQEENRSLKGNMSEASKQYNNLLEKLEDSKTAFKQISDSNEKLERANTLLRVELEAMTALHADEVKKRLKK